jgi:Na+/H+ antiporter NhaD/arsenite permease-like protein
VNLPLWTLAAVLLLIAFRRLAGLRLAIWQIMSGGALVVLLGGALSPTQAWQAIDWGVIAYLAGVFVLGRALVESALLHRLSGRFLGRVKRADTLVLAVLMASGLASALLMNDTLAVIGTPLMLALARAHRLPPVLLLLALAFGVTIGSVMSPIGNPQNLLIALHGGLANPFLTFLRGLALPTLVSLLLAWVVLRLAFRRDFHGHALLHDAPDLADTRLARLAAIGLALLLAMVMLKMFLTMVHAPLQVPLWMFALVASAPVLFGSPRRIEIVRGIDWPTLVFFAAMFVLMRAVWDSGAIQSWLPSDTGHAGVPQVLTASILLSQLISNVPFVALVLPLLHDRGPEAMLALAAGSTLAGNLTLIGAASNIIIAQAAEREGVHLGFWRFMAIGAPLTLTCAFVYWLLL